MPTIFTAAEPIRFYLPRRRPASSNSAAILLNQVQMVVQKCPVPSGVQSDPSNNSRRFVSGLSGEGMADDLDVDFG